MLPLVTHHERAVADILIHTHGVRRSDAHRLVLEHRRHLSPVTSNAHSDAARVLRRARRAYHASGASARDPKLDKKALWKSIDKDERARARAKLKALQHGVQHAAGGRQAAQLEAKVQCALDRQEASERAKAIRAVKRAEAKEAGAAVRAAARQKCAAGKASPRLEVARRRAELKAEREHQASLRRIMRANKAKAAVGHPGGGRARAHELVTESDDEVRQNVPADLIPLFERVKRSIKGSGRKSRTEAFMQYVEEHPREANQAIEDKTDAMVRQLEARQRRGR
jgi:hypothetical protein